MVSLPIYGGGALESGAVLCIGRSYAAHVDELRNAVPDEPVVFQKNGASLRALGASGQIAFPNETFHHEAELVLVIGAAVGLGQPADWSSVSHVALGLDITRRDVQSALKAKGLPWHRAKSFYGSAPISPLVPLDRVGDITQIGLQLSVNGALRQRGFLSQMIFPIPVLLSAIAELQPLDPGDLIFTGTPAGVGPLRVGDNFTLELLPAGLAFKGQL